MVVTFSKRWTLGLIMLGIVIILWVLSSFLINLIFEDDSYRKPFFITYLNTAAFIFYLLPTGNSILTNYKETGNFNIHHELIIEEEGDPNDENSWEYADMPTGQEQEQEQEQSSTPEIEGDDLLSVRSPLIPKDHQQISTSTSNYIDAERNNNNVYTTNRNSSTVTAHLKRLSLKETIKLSAEFCILWFLANFATNASLAYTSVASQTILSSTSSFFTLFIGALFHVEMINPLKVIGSTVSFIGIMSVIESDSHSLRKGRHLPTSSSIDENGNDTTRILIGNLLAIAGALFYGIYSTLLKRKVKDESRINVKIFFGFVGLFTLVFLWPTIIILHYLGWESFEIPTDPRVICIVLMNCMITFVSDFCWAKAMLLTSPLTVTVGLSITVPLAMVGDLIFKHKSMPFLYLIGATLILGSFFIINESSAEDNLDQLINERERSADVEASTVT
ncbi:uncharacterized protein NDAI_0C00940 [Naumovozyma dairenensis CBS 421]|uniref:Uncharacterized protein n=1 Tax=Naumovozyma dairenensis (strain ATCC 10597 / BCRC 20456 / CBS 421 / NBRC 0211 / NRRL Y-12639) TaxID=1071378 RepID=G0W7J4_NAUDC|nr:hypothetical protein NDAI_0C00940 [Naumovozyma dairenensis CBS 421]CCD23755.1 hypothetical protein NDAI_0C00940 [Naumovozyma dairenensis CBS 421]